MSCGNAEEKVTDAQGNKTSQKKYIWAEPQRFGKWFHRDTGEDREAYYEVLVWTNVGKVGND